MWKTFDCIRREQLEQTAVALAKASFAPPKPVGVNRGERVALQRRREAPSEIAVDRGVPANPS
jgi:hypothetical protein